MSTQRKSSITPEPRVEEAADGLRPESPGDASAIVSDPRSEELADEDLDAVAGGGYGGGGKRPRRNA